jgi:tRNA-splicing ligase RtcB
MDYKIWGKELIDEASIEQFELACCIEPAVKAALMPDAHVGYSIPIGGVIALKNAIVPHFVGVDIACRMRITLFNKDGENFADQSFKRNLYAALLKETKFGVGAKFDPKERREHSIMNDERWNATEYIQGLKEKAEEQLGTSGSGNHFVSWGFVETDGIPELNIKSGNYIALISHSGSRGIGLQICNYYANIAKEIYGQNREIPWLDLDSVSGKEYFEAMGLAGDYASANHQLIHEHVASAAQLEPIGYVENHHNFAWKEIHDGEELIVHRKGATPAQKGTLGVIPGTMADFSYIVRGLGNKESLNSASHGAGRVMSRKKAKKELSREQMALILKEREVQLIDAGLDESPEVYKNIDEVLDAQKDLVEKIGRFSPKIVRMSNDGKSED